MNSLVYSKINLSLKELQFTGLALYRVAGSYCAKTLEVP